ncbi:MULTISPECIES: DUF3077 domain-containing protein [unclassified Pseudomonas]|uniref:DUF3077 domain-containing protein n=1 Tax=unclassified Pseudomonas TaxID=196821 RepID=UPI001314E943|nr:MULTISPECIES: DUF3077 domain-containing protein [unclassified Pseudomonas]
MTTEKEFSAVGPATEKLKIFKVAEGIDAEHALNKASDLLEIIVDSIEDAAMGTVKFDGHSAWLALHAAESAKAIVDALWNSLELADRGGEL